MMTLTLFKAYVIAWNTPLRESVHQMSPIILLRNAHPTYRGVFASQLLEAGYITKFEASEFITTVGR
jgi:hypothetical protein